MAPLRADEAQQMRKICNVLRLINAKRTTVRTQGTERLLRPGPRGKGGGGGGGGGGFLKNGMNENITPPPPPPGGLVVELLRSPWAQRLVTDADIASSLNLNWQEKQSEVRRNSSKGTYLRSSLKCLDNNDVLLLLESILQSSKEGTQKFEQLGVWEQYRSI